MSTENNIKELQERLNELQEVLRKAESNPVWESMTVNVFEYHFNRYEQCMSTDFHKSAKSHLSKLIILLQGKILRDHCG